MVASKRKSGSQSSQNMSVVTASQCFRIEDVIAAIESLYADELKPASKLLRKRIYDRINAVTGSAGTVDVDMKRLWHMCNECTKLSLRVEDTGEWSAEIIGHRRSFVDINSPCDPYPGSLWASFTKFCESPEGDGLCLSGGRCAAAEALRDCKLSCLANFSLGRICHIVELALNQKKLLGYKNSCIVPYRLSERAQKEQSALQQQPSADSEIEVATLETARECLRILLHDAPDGTIPLPNVKRLFRSRFHMQLSETTFGYTKVSDLLQDSRFKDMCTVEFNGGFTVKRKVKVISLLDGLNVDISRESTAEDEPCRVQFCQDEPLQMDEAEVLPEDAPVWLAPSPAPTAPRWSLSLSTLSKESYAGIVRNTFIHADLPPPTPLLRAPRRVRTVPKDMSFKGIPCQAADVGSDDSTTDSTGSSPSSSPQTSSNTGDWLLQSLDNLMTFTPFDESTSRSATPRLRLSSGEPLSLEPAASNGTLWSLGSSTSLTPLLPSDCNDLDVSVLPFCICTPMVPEDSELPVIVDGLCCRNDKQPKRRITARVHFAYDTKSEIANAFNAEESMRPCDKFDRTARPIWPALTPGALSKEGFVVRGGFLDVPPVLPTPFRESASRRSHSVPKSMGSESCSAEESCLEYSNVCLSASPSQHMFPPTPWQY